MLRLSYEKRDLGFSFGIAVAVMVAASLVLTFIFGSEADGWRFWLMQALYTLGIGSSVFIYDAIARINPIAASRLNIKPHLAHVGWGILATVCLIFAMMPINYMFMKGIEQLGLPSQGVDIPEGVDNLAGLLIVAAVLPAFCEELIFRGAVAQSAGTMKNKLAALALSGGLFALFHANPAQTVHQFMLGALLTLLVLRSGSLWTSVLVHLFNNVLVVSLNFTVLGDDAFWSIKNNTAIVLPIMLAGIIGFAASVFGYLKTTHSVWTSSSEEKSHPQDSASAIVLCVSACICLFLWFTKLFLGAE